MPAKDELEHVPYTPDPDTAIRVGWAVTALGVLIFIVSALGEYLGWWDLAGEVGMWVGALLTVVVGAGTWFSGASRGQVAEMGKQLGGIGGEVRGVRHVVEENGAKLDSVDGKLDKLDVIEGALVAEDGETSRLDVVQVELDRQTGVLDRQLSVLGEIRDAI